MARFYVQSNRWGTVFEDHGDIGGADLAEAREEALRLGRAFMNSEAAKGRPCLTCCIDVASAPGSTVITISPQDAG